MLNFLKRETVQRNASILYATHIFDGLGGWPTHIAHVVAGEIDLVRDLSQGFPELDEAIHDRQVSAAATGNAESVAESLVYNSPLLLVVERWLREDNKKLMKAGVTNAEGKLMTKWDILSENMKEYGDKYYNYWRKDE